MSFGFTNYMGLGLVLTKPDPRAILDEFWEGLDFLKLYLSSLVLSDFEGIDLWALKMDLLYGPYQLLH